MYRVERRATADPAWQDGHIDLAGPVGPLHPCTLRLPSAAASAAGVDESCAYLVHVVDVGFPISKATLSHYQQLSRVYDACACVQVLGSLVRVYKRLLWLRAWSWEGRGGRGGEHHLPRLVPFGAPWSVSSPRRVPETHPADSCMRASVRA